MVAFLEINSEKLYAANTGLRKRRLATGMSVYDKALRQSIPEGLESAIIPAYALTVRLGL
jgi:hypothetical protein